MSFLSSAQCDVIAREEMDHWNNSVEVEIEVFMPSDDVEIDKSPSINLVKSKSEEEMGMATPKEQIHHLQCENDELQRENLKLQRFNHSFQLYEKKLWEENRSLRSKVQLLSKELQKRNSKEVKRCRFSFS